jgi:predicted RNA-binding protein with PUA-like domain
VSRPTGVFNIQHRNERSHIRESDQCFFWHS